MRDETRIRKILPVNLMLEGRSCLVVGGGPIAARKVGHLVDAGANVTLVSATAVPELQRRIAAGKVAHRARDFRDADVKRHFLVMAATSNGAVNARVVRLCRRAGILCASADEHWMEADFVTPATLRRPRLTLTVSTGGESCRRSRLVKDTLGRHLDRLDRAELAVWAAPRQPVAGLGARLAQVWGIQEFVILDGLSRFEVLAVASREGGVDRLMGDILGRRGAARRAQRGLAALRHALALAAGPEAKALERALQRGVTAGWASVVMQDWIKTALRLGGTDARLPAANGKSQNREYQRQYERIIRGL